jgi:hypothetical protein
MRGDEGGGIQGEQGASEGESEGEGGGMDRKRRSHSPIWVDDMNDPAECCIEGDAGV